jgi:hypothetical protein
MTLGDGVVAVGVDDGAVSVLRLPTVAMAK